AMPANNMISDYQNFICDLVDAAGNTYGERYGGLIESNLTITVYAKYTQQRDEVVDIINYGIFQGKRRALESQGITVMTVSIEGESEEEFGQDKIYVMSIGARLYSHWYSDTLYEQIEDIRTEVTSPGPPNNPGLPEDPYTPIRIIHTPAEPIEEPGALARV